MAKVKIFLIEDKSHGRKDIIDILKKNRYDVTAVEYPGAKFNSLLSNVPRFDLIIADRKPYENLRAKKKIFPKLTEAIPVMMIRDAADRGGKQRKFVPSPFEIIHYPSEEKALLSGIESALYAHDMSSRLKENERQYKSLIELAPIAIGIHCDGKIVYANPAAVKLLEAKNMDELIGIPVINFVHPDDRSKTLERVKTVLTKKKNVNVINEKFITRKGNTIDVEVTAMPTTYVNKPAVQVTINDVTEVRRREKINQAAIDISRAADSSSSPDQLYVYIHKILAGIMPAKNFFIALLDSTGSKLSFPYFSDEKVSRPEPRELGKGLTEYMLLGKKPLLLSKEKITALINKGKIQKNNLIAEIVIGVPLIIKRNVIGIMVVKKYDGNEELGVKEKEMLELISFPVSGAIERKKAEKERKNYIEELKELNSTKDKFFSIISHDLRSPFNSILGFTEIMKEELPNLTQGELKTYIDSLYQSTRNIYGLLNNLLQFSRFQIGSLELYPEVINLKEMTDRSLNMMRGNAVRKNITLISDIDHETTVLADIDMLNSVLQNLLSNAIKFTRSRGVVKLESEEKSDKIEIKVSDTGIGMSKKLLSGLFKIENRKSRRGTHNEGGTGLGLLLTKEYIEKDGGTLLVESKAGKGTVFTFSLNKPKPSEK